MTAQKASLVLRKATDCLSEATETERRRMQMRRIAHEIGHTLIGEFWQSHGLTYPWETARPVVLAPPLPSLRRQGSASGLLHITFAQDTGNSQHCR